MPLSAHSLAILKPLSATTIKLEVQRLDIHSQLSKPYHLFGLGRHPMQTLFGYSGYRLLTISMCCGVYSHSMSHSVEKGPLVSQQIIPCSQLLSGGTEAT